MANKPSYPFLLLSSLALAACGGGSGSVIDVANGGIGGTGTGTVTGFGSIIVNDIRKFEFGSGTNVVIDGESLSEDDLRIGMVVQVTVGDDANADFTAGTLTSVRADSLVKGPVTGINPLRVLGQDIEVVSSTILDGVPGNDPGLLVPGDIVEVAGFRDGAVVRASRLEYHPGGLPVWKLTGTVAGLNANTSLAIGTQTVLFNGVLPRDCNGGLQNGNTVEIKAAAVSGFASGDSLGSTTDIECQPSGLQLPDGVSASSVKASVEGFIGNFVSPASFTVNGQAIATDSSTVFEGGVQADLAIGVRLEAEGQLRTASGVLQASKIRIREARFRLEAPLAVDDIGNGEQITLLGVTVNRLAGTNDEDDVFGGLDEATQVEVRGFVDANGNAYADEVTMRGEPDMDDTRLRGPVQSVSEPLVTVLGVTIDTNGAVLRSASGAVIDADTFFANLSPGQPIQVQDAAFDADNLQLSGGEIELED
jgi:hypothetical protein